MNVYLTQNLTVGRCPHCGVASPTLERLWETSTTAYNGTNPRVWKVYKCNTCGSLVTAAATSNGGEVIETYPEHQETDIAIPSRAKEYLDQAVNSLHTPAGAVMLAASSVDEMLKQKGYVEGKLYPRIKQALKDNLITPEMAKWAHQVRLDANDQRHSDVNADLPTREDGERSVTFAKAFAEFLFVLPSKVNRGLEETATEIDS